MMLLILGRFEEASKESKRLLDTVDGYDSPYWINKARLQYLANFADKEAEATLLSEVSNSRPAQCGAQYVIGLAALGRGDLKLAKVHFKNCIGSGQFERLDYCMAKAFLRIIQADRG